MMDLSQPLEKKELLEWEGPLPPHLESNDDYHADYEFKTSSKIKVLFNEGPKGFKDSLNPLIKKETESMGLGTMKHDVNLEGNLDRYVLAKHFDTIAERKRRGETDLRSIKELKEDYEAEMSEDGKVIVTKAIYETLHMSNTRFTNNKEMQRIMRDCEVEVGFLFLHEESGVKCKFRADLFDQENAIIYDYKTTSSPLNHEALTRDVVKYGYHISAAHYLYGAERLFNKKFEYKWIFQSTSLPHNLLFFDLKVVDKNKSMELHSKIMGRLGECQRTNDFSQDFTTIKRSISLPEFAFNTRWL